MILVSLLCAEHMERCCVKAGWWLNGSPEPCGTNQFAQLSSPPSGICFISRESVGNKKDSRVHPRWSAPIIGDFFSPPCLDLSSCDRRCKMFSSNFPCNCENLVCRDRISTRPTSQKNLPQCMLCKSDPETGFGGDVFKLCHFIHLVTSS